MVEDAPQSNDTFDNGNDAAVAPLESNRLILYVKTLRRIAFVLSAVTLAVLAAVYLILVFFPFRLSWVTRSYTIELIELMIVIFFVSFLNVSVTIPAFLNIIADFGFTWGIIACLVNFMNEFPHYEWCYQWGSQAPVHPKCVQWRLVLTILMGISSGFAIILGAVLVILFLLEIYTIIKSKFWNKASMSLPTGELTWTMSLKFKRADEEESSGQGPVHL